MQRVYEPLPEETEEVISTIVDAGIRVHRELGPGFVEVVYRRNELTCLSITGWS